VALFSLPINLETVATTLGFINIVAAKIGALSAHFGSLRI